MGKSLLEFTQTEIGSNGKEFLALLVADRKSWQVSALDLGVRPLDLMNLYCVDADTGCRWLGEVSYSSFCELRSEVVERGELHTHAEKLHALIIRSSLDRKLLPLATVYSSDDLAAQEISLIGELACVLAMTPWAFNAERVHPGCHLVTIRVREKGLPLFHSFAVPISTDWGVGPLSDAALVDACQSLLASR